MVTVKITKEQKSSREAIDSHANAHRSTMRTQK